METSRKLAALLHLVDSGVGQRNNLAEFRPTDCLLL